MVFKKRFLKIDVLAYKLKQRVICFKFAENYLIYQIRVTKTWKNFKIIMASKIW